MIITKLFQLWLFILTLIISYNVKAQDLKINDVVLQNEYDSVKALLNKRDFNAVVDKSKILLKESLKKNNKVALNFASQIQGTAWQNLGYTDSAIVYHKNSLDGFIALKDEKNASFSKVHLGNDYLNIAKYDISVSYFLEALKYFEKNKIEEGMAQSYSGLGNLNYYQNNPQKAEEYYTKAIEVNQKLNNLIAIGYIENNLGCLFLNKQTVDKGIEHIMKALEIFEKLNDKKGISMVSSGIGSGYFIKKEYEKALPYYFKSLEMDKSLGTKIGEGQTLLNISSSYFYLNKNKEAIKYALESLKIFEELKDMDNARANYYSLYQLYNKEESYKTALDYYIKYKISSDSLNNFETTRLIAQKEIQYEYDKKSLADSVKNIEAQKIKDAQIENQNLQIKQEQTQRYALYGGLVLVLIGAGFIYNRFKITNHQNKLIERQKEEVESQKNLLEEKNKEILDSITYAKRLQEAILPPIDYINELIPNNFVLYKPKDIVAGDFYWMEKVNKHDSFQQVLFAVGDCTGHGVPGALVSVVCSNALNRAVVEFNLIEPGLILDKTRELVLETFSKSSTEVKDGMDISMISISKDNQNSEKLTVKWSGANNPLWYYSNKIFNEKKANKQPIGKVDNPLPFQTHTLELYKGDILFLFTDGFADQFGGLKGKKFKYKQMQEVIKQYIELGLDTTKEQLEKAFLNWKANLEQVDDVCIVAIQL